MRIPQSGVRTKCPQLFGGVDLATAPQEAFVELQRAHARLMEAHARVAGVWERWDHDIYDYNKDGESCKAFHPEQLAKRQELLPLTAFGSEDDYLKGAQRRFSSIVHHAAWWKLLQRLRGQDVEAARGAAPSAAPVAGSPREAARFISVSQAYAGAFLNAVPKQAAFRMPTWALRIALQRRLGLPLTAATAAAGGGGGGRRSRHGKLFDGYGDVAQNDGESGHQTRHFLILNALYDAMRRVYGGQVRREPADCTEYSDHRPDLTLLLEGLLTVFDLKVFAPIGSDAGEVGLRGGFVGFGNTAPHGQLLVHGRRERLGPPATFNPNTGAGYVSPKEGDYARAEALGVRVVLMLVETFGGLGPALVEELRKGAEWRANKLTASEYDETTWSARTWMAFTTQRLSVAVQYSAAQEVAEALGLSVAADPRAAP